MTLPVDLARLCDGRQWHGKSKSALIDLVPSAKFPGYWHIRIIDGNAMSMVDTKRPVAAHAIKMMIEGDGISFADFAWTPHATEQVKKRMERDESHESKHIVYFLRAGKFIKIGTTQQTPDLRISELQTGCPYDIVVIGTMTGGRKEESALHKKFYHLKSRQRGEWFHHRDELKNFIKGLS